MSSTQIISISFFLPIISLLSLHKTHAAEIPKEIQGLVNKHISARDSINSNYCTVDFAIIAKTAKGEIKQKVTGKYWYTHGAVRLEVNEDHGFNTYIWKDSVRRTLLTRKLEGKTEFGAGIDGYLSSHMHRGDAWVRGLLTVNIPDTITHVPLEKLFDHGADFVKSWEEEVDGKKMPIIRVVFPTSSEKEPVTWKIDIQFDPAFNYLIKKIIYFTGRTPNSGEYSKQEEVLKYVEPMPGIYFPERIVGKSGFSEMVDSTSETKLGDIQVNRNFPNSTFQIKYPHGIYVTDSLTNSRYQVDSNGNRISKSEPLVKSAPPPSSESLPESERLTETIEEPASTTHYWIIATAGLIFLAALGVAVYRRFSQSRI